MKQLLQRFDSGAVSLTDCPVPTAGDGHIVVASRASVISAGTERTLVGFGRSGWIEKARRHPDKVRQVLDRMRTDGVVSTVEAVRSRLSEPIPLGYCQSGVVVEVGASVRDFAVGDRVVTNGPHAEYVRVPRLLAAQLPAGVSHDAGAFAPLAAIGLQGVRVAEVTLGETVVVYGLGLVGLLTVQLLRANGCRVLGIDRDEERLALAERFGATVLPAAIDDLVPRVVSMAEGRGADAVLLTLASESDEPVHLAAQMSRKRGRLVLVGVTGLQLRRDDFYEKELSFTVSCSYGPGRYDPSYESAGVDYPAGYVRWTEQRNIAAVLALMDEGSLDVSPLVSHRFDFSEATGAYDLLTGSRPSLGIVLEYPSQPDAAAVEAGRTVWLRRRGPGEQPVAASRCSVGVIGAGNFATRTIIPAIEKAGGRLRSIATSGGVSAGVAAQTFGFEVVSSDAGDVLEDPEVDAVFVLTRHDSHASLVVRALEAGKDVFVEKPLALTLDDVDRVEDALGRSGRLLTIGFNRRFSPHAEHVRRAVKERVGPLAVLATVNAGSVPPDHWVQDPDVGGGRIVGEACHMLDLAVDLVGAPIEDVQVTAARQDGARVVDDIVLLSVAFADGSIASIHYLSNGPRAFPKERIECFFDGKALQIDNWRGVRGYGSRGSGFSLLRTQAKGHDQEVARWLEAVKTRGEPPIPTEQLFDVSRWAIRAAAMARSAP